MSYFYVIFTSIFFFYSSTTLLYSLSLHDALPIYKRLKLDVDLDTRYLTKEDIVAIVKEVIRLKELKSHVDDIDQLSNRRVRTVGEQLGQQFVIGLASVSGTLHARIN